MKRIHAVVLALVLLAGLAAPVRSQTVVDTSSASRWYIGIKGGFLLSTMWGPDRAEVGTVVESMLYSVLAGASAGVNFPIFITDRFILEPEVLFTTKGMKWTDTSIAHYEGEIEQTVMRRHSYIEIPVLAKLLLLPEKRIKPVLYLGPQLGLCVRSYTKISGDNLRRDWNLLADSSSVVDFSMVGGVGIHIRAGRGFFVVDIRGALGIPDQAAADDRILRNIAGLGYIGYCFNPKKRTSLW